MKKNLLLLVAFCALVFASCSKDEAEDTTLSNLVITSNIAANVVDFTASANNALSYAWDFGNGQVASGSAVQTTFVLNGKYWVKCTATGKTDKLTDSVMVEIIEGGRQISALETLLCGYDEETRESSAVWYWAANKPQMLSGGMKSHHYEHDSALYDLFDPIDQSWWAEEGPSMPEALNDAYSFKFNPSFDYACDYKEDGFVCNWAYAHHRYGIKVEQYGDIIRFDNPKTGSWSIETYAHADYPDFTTDAPKTLINGVAEDVSYFLKINGGAYLFQESGVAEYQILSITEDTVMLRFDYAVPMDLTMDSDWEYPDWITIGEGEWGYAYLVKNSSATEEQ